MKTVKADFILYSLRLNCFFTQLCWQVRSLSCHANINLTLVIASHLTLWVATAYLLSYRARNNSLPTTCSNLLMKDKGSHYYFPTVCLVIKLSKLQLVSIIFLCLSQHSSLTLLLHHHHHLQDLSISLYSPIWYPKHLLSYTLCEQFFLSFFSHSLPPRDVYVGSLHWENKKEIDRWLGWSSPFPKSRPDNLTSKGE